MRECTNRYWISNSNCGIRMWDNNVLMSRLNKFLFRSLFEVNSLNTPLNTHTLRKYSSLSSFIADKLRILRKSVVWAMVVRLRYNEQFVHISWSLWMLWSVKYSGCLVSDGCALFGKCYNCPLLPKWNCNRKYTKQNIVYIPCFLRLQWEYNFMFDWFESWLIINTLKI